MKRNRRESIDYSSWTLEQFKEDLKTNPDYLAYYEKFDPESIDAFVSRYATVKFQMFQNEASYKHGTEWYKGRHLELADKYIDAILQKKLFNLQCQWRAGLIDLPLISISREFEYWSNHIRACPFIPIVTPEEVDLCKSFLETEYDFYADAIVIGNKWQDYDTFKYESEQDEEEMDDDETRGAFTSSLPPLYLYFDTYQNTSSLINLPDLRGEKEEMYLNLSFHIQRTEKEEQEKQNPKVETVTEPYISTYKPHLFGGDQDIKTFVEAVENRESKIAHRYYYDNYHLDRDRDFMDVVLDLEAFKEPFPIEAHEDWREAIRLLLLKQNQLKAAELLPYVYEAYLFEFDEPHNFKKIMADKIARHKYEENDALLTLIDHYKTYILHARKALREEENFDYL